MVTSVNTPDSAWSVNEVNTKVKGWIERLGHIWVEGQLTQVKTNPSWRMSYLTLRDTEVEASVAITCPTALITQAPRPFRDGDRVVVYGKPAFYVGRGSYSLWVTHIRPVGLGELLARIDMLRRKLSAEGLSDPARKKRPPFLPRKIGLITGRGSAAERDVLAVSKERWPDVRFEIVNTAVQGVEAVPQIIDALKQLDAVADVDVIIIARGGGSVEDLLPFSEEALLRAVAQTRTPVVSAIGHEPDNPVLDDIADIRAATPTDAAKRIVPDVLQERANIREARKRTAAALRGWVDREQAGLAQTRSRPVLADPFSPLRARRDEIIQAYNQARRDIIHLIDKEQSRVTGLRAQITTLGPGATLARGYAVVQVRPRDGGDNEVVTSISQSPPGSQLRIRVSDGSITAASMGVHPAD
ncbi:exodeoxyribonuclease VII large subunit [Corynebacterium sp. 3HC-13]|uniref:exodeoxyribonuclease VII large subunit n=1 Tax=Corynebacterium poyangense TaxID=2684405 RepID=UPI001CCDA6F4|nr:exodeoxyribonuclease VII large subunit [Corynebacterium poyangense]MBZ8176974.1 exodeoxyribonuclease VII large subunit [Corynebacterium poyangense]